MIPQTVIALGVIMAALIAGYLSFLNLVISKEQKISELRQIWIDTMREDIAQYISSVIYLCGGNRRREQEKNGYDLQLMSVDDVSYLPKREQNTVIVAKINNFYHVRIFNIDRKMVLDKGKDLFSPSSALFQALDDALNAKKDQQIDLNVERQLIQWIVSNLGYAYEKNQDDKLTEHDYWKSVESFYDNASRAYTSIVLKLNLDNKDAKLKKLNEEFLNKLKEVRQAYKDDEYVKAIELANELHNLAQPILQLEWERIKSGERRYRCYRNIAATALIIGLTLSGLSFYYVTIDPEPNSGHWICILPKSIGENRNICLNNRCQINIIHP